MSNNKNTDILKKELARYFYNGFILIQQKSSLQNTLKFVERNFSRIIYGKKDGKIFGAAAFLTLTTETFERLKRNEIDFQIPKHMEQGEKERGEHIHFFAVHTEGADMLRLGIKSIIKRKNPKSVSWTSPKDKKLCVYESRTKT